MSPDTRHRTHSRSDNAAVVLYIPESVIRVRVVVEGRVQGVFYRQGCQRVAVSNRLTGWVRNNRGGSVEAVLEASRTRWTGSWRGCESALPRCCEQRRHHRGNASEL